MSDESPTPTLAPERVWLDRVGASSFEPAEYVRADLAALDAPQQEPVVTIQGIEKALAYLAADKAPNEDIARAEYELHQVLTALRALPPGEPAAQEQERVKEAARKIQDDIEYAVRLGQPYVPGLDWLVEIIGGAVSQSGTIERVARLVEAYPFAPDQEGDKETIASAIRALAAGESASTSKPSAETRDCKCGWRWYRNEGPCRKCDGPDWSEPAAVPDPQASKFTDEALAKVQKLIELSDVAGVPREPEEPEL